MKTGVKDAFTQHWIDELISKAWSMQKLQPSQPLYKIQTELMEWVDANKPAIYNSFLTMPGAPLRTLSLRCNNNNHADRFWSILWYTHRNPSYDIAWYCQIYLAWVTFIVDTSATETIFNMTPVNQSFWSLNSLYPSKLHHAIHKLLDLSSIEDTGLSECIPYIWSRR